MGLRKLGLSQLEAIPYTVRYVKSAPQDKDRPYTVEEAMKTLGNVYDYDEGGFIPSIEQVAQQVDNIGDSGKAPTLFFVDEEQYKEKVRKTPQHTCQKSKKKTNVSFPNEGYGDIVAMPGFAKSWECPGCVYPYLRDKEKNRLRLVYPDGFYPIVLSPYNDRKPSDRKMYDYITNKLYRDGSVNFGIVSPVNDSAVILFSIPLDATRLMRWGDSSTDEFLNKYLCHEPGGLNGMKKIRPSQRFMKRLREIEMEHSGFKKSNELVAQTVGAPGKEPEEVQAPKRVTVTINAPLWQVCEDLRALGCEEREFIPTEDNISDIEPEADCLSPRDRKLIRVFKPTPEALEILRQRYLEHDSHKVTPIFKDNSLYHAYRPGKRIRA